jgi:2-oxoisovalerate dehydrogenase E2 component (dihydrolipoyl transacylase)
MLKPAIFLHRSRLPASAGCSQWQGKSRGASGSTITVSSLGALGGVAATPIIKPPEVAIVGVNKIVSVRWC